MADREQKFLKSFGKRLADLRKQRGLSQEELADRAGLHAVAITYIETGKRLPKLNTIYKLATGLDVKAEALFKGLWVIFETPPVGHPGFTTKRDRTILTHPTARLTDYFL